VVGLASVALLWLFVNGQLSLAPMELQHKLEQRRFE
jgi:hypothetical protein